MYMYIYVGENTRLSPRTLSNQARHVNPAPDNTQIHTDNISETGRTLHDGESVRQ